MPVIESGDSFYIILVSRFPDSDINKRIKGYDLTGNVAIPLPIKQVTVN